MSCALAAEAPRFLTCSSNTQVMRENGRLKSAGQLHPKMSEVALWEQFDLTHRSLALRLDRALEREHALSLAGFGLLRALVAVTGARLRMSDLAARLDFTPSGVTRLVERLESDGSVRRLRDDADRRVVHAELTTRGAATLAAAVETYDVTVRALLRERFSDGELRGLSKALHKLTTTTPASGKDAS